MAGSASWYHSGCNPILWGVEKQLYSFYKSSLYKNRNAALEIIQRPPILLTSPKPPLFILKGLLILQKIWTSKKKTLPRETDIFSLCFWEVNVLPSLLYEPRAVRSLFTSLYMFMYIYVCTLYRWVIFFLPPMEFPKLICKDLNLTGLKKTKHLYKSSILSKI